jgi:hypothetical protein
MPPPTEVQHVTPTQGDRPDALDGTDNQFFRGLRKSSEPVEPGEPPPRLPVHAAGTPKGLHATVKE